jgi:phage gp36-like protein
MTIDRKLLDYCTTTIQKRNINAVVDSGSVEAACRELQVDRRALQRSIATVRKNAADRGYAPGHWESGTAAGRKMGKVTIQRGADGEIQRTWERQVDEDKQNALMAFAQMLTADIEPAKPKPLPKIKKHDPDMLTGIFIGDAHVGMRAFGKETKHSNFDTDIATQQLRDAADYLVAKAEPTETGLLVNVGDFMHANTQHNTTFSGTPLDVDSRHYAVMEAAAETMAYMVDRMLSKFKKVVLICARGNHDTDVAGAITLMMKFYYRNEKRVNVLDSDGFYHYVEYGNWLLGVHHGDKQKPESLAGSMARDMAKAWGRTTHRLWCCGHFHKENVKVLPGCKYKVFAAMPPPDSWHASHGYLGDGEMEMLTFKKSGGLYSSHVFNIPQPQHDPDVTI